jgi:hypothetical protein
MLVAGIRYITIDEEEKVSEIKVPVQLLADVDDEEIGPFIVSVLQSDGTLVVSVCPRCFSLVPTRNVNAHMETSHVQ